jgi:hypothetical protein
MTRKYKRSRSRSKKSGTTHSRSRFIEEDSYNDSTQFIVEDPYESKNGDFDIDNFKERLAIITSKLSKRIKNSKNLRLYIKEFVEVLPFPNRLGSNYSSLTNICRSNDYGSVIDIYIDQDEYDNLIEKYLTLYPTGRRYNELDYVKVNIETYLRFVSNDMNLKLHAIDIIRPPIVDDNSESFMTKFTNLFGRTVDHKYIGTWYIGGQETPDKSNIYVAILDDMTRKQFNNFETYYELIEYLNQRYPGEPVPESENLDTSLDGGRFLRLVPISEESEEEEEYEVAKAKAIFQEDIDEFLKSNPRRALGMLDINR